MELQKAQDIFTQAREEFSFASGFQKQSIVRGLNILAKYDDDLDFVFEHDQLWTGGFTSILTQMTEEEIREMAIYGWFEDEGNWSHF